MAVIDLTRPDPQVLESARQFFKRMNRLMVLMWRLGLGKYLNAYPDVGGRIMVIVHTGRKTGITRYTPVNYTHMNDDLVCTAGFGAGSDWYKNIMAQPTIDVWLPDGSWHAIAEDVSSDPDRLLMMRQVLIASGIVAPMIGFNPKTMSNEDLDAATHDYRLVRIRLTEKLPSEPGKTVRVYPYIKYIPLALAALIASAILLKRKFNHMRTA